MGVVNSHCGGGGVVSSEDDASILPGGLDADPFEGGLAIDQAGADTPLHVFGIDVGAIVYQNNVTRLESGFHAVHAETKAIAVGRAKMMKHREEFAGFLCLRGGPGGDRPEEGQLRSLQRLGGIMFSVFADEDSDGQIQSLAEGPEGGRSGPAGTSLDLAEESLIDPGLAGELRLCETH